MCAVGTSPEPVRYPYANRLDVPRMARSRRGPAGSQHGRSTPKPVTQDHVTDADLGFTWQVLGSNNVG